MKKKCGRTLDVLNRYKTYTILNYIRKGYQPIIGKAKNEQQENKTYTELLRKLSDEYSER